MIGMVVRHDHLRQALPGQRPGQDRIPCRPAVSRGKAGVEHGPASIVLDEVDVHVVEPVGQRQAEPQHAGRDRGHGAGGGRLRMREDEGTCDGVHEPYLARDAGSREIGSGCHGDTVCRMLRA